MSHGKRWNLRKFASFSCQLQVNAARVCHFLDAAAQRYTSITVYQTAPVQTRHRSTDFLGIKKWHFRLNSHRKQADIIPKIVDSTNERCFAASAWDTVTYACSQAQYC